MRPEDIMLAYVTCPDLRTHGWPLDAGLPDYLERIGAAVAPR